MHREDVIHSGLRPYLAKALEEFRENLNYPISQNIKVLRCVVSVGSNPDFYLLLFLKLNLTSKGDYFEV
jgi:hypothetical protein